MLAIWRGITDPLARSRRTWLSFCWALIGLLYALGALYAFGGAHLVVATKSFVIFTGFLEPVGGLHAHGVIMLILAGAMTAEMLGPRYGRLLERKYMARTLLAVGAYFSWTAFAFAAAPLAGGKTSASGVIVWLFLSAVPLILKLWPPPARGLIEDAALLAAAYRVGIDHDRALSLVEAYLHGGGHGTVH